MSGSVVERELNKRCQLIKDKIRAEINRKDETQCEKMTIQFDKDKIKTSVDVANWLLDTYKSIKEQNKSLLTTISIEIIKKPEETVMEVAEKPIEKEKEIEKPEETCNTQTEPSTPTVASEPPKEAASNSARPNANKKRKFEHGKENESWLTRRSLRGQDKIELINVTFQDSLKKYTNENFVVEAPKMGYNANDSSQKDSEKNAVKFKSLSDEDSAFIEAFLSDVQSDVDVIYMMKVLLRMLALKSSFIW